jgi:hypothetical protein
MRLRLHMAGITVDADVDWNDGFELVSDVQVRYNFGHDGCNAPSGPRYKSGKLFTRAGITAFVISDRKDVLGGAVCKVWS